jgi:hypothetical protein
MVGCAGVLRCAARHWVNRLYHGGGFYGGNYFLSWSCRWALEKSDSVLLVYAFGYPYGLFDGICDASISHKWFGRKSRSAIHPLRNRWITKLGLSYFGGRALYDYYE